MYYLVYVVLRPDTAWRLISFPYYAKYSKAGDSTAFQYIDLNLNKYLLNGRGGNAI
jgi:hypothetical protein